jgi:uncharacterized protein YggE
MSSKTERDLITTSSATSLPASRMRINVRRNEVKKIIVLLCLITVVPVAQAAPLPDYPFVFARGEAEAKLAPDIARVSYRIKAFDKISTNVLTAIEAGSLETLAVLATNGVKKEDVVGFEIEKDTIRTRDRETYKELEIVGYNMNRRIEFTMRDLSKYEPIISHLLKTPNVADIRTEFDRIDRTRVEEKLLADAVSDARHKADLMAKGSQQRIKGLKAISQQGFYNLGETFGLGNVKYDHVAYSINKPPERELLFIPATVEFRSSVFVIYEVEEGK